MIFLDDVRLNFAKFPNGETHMPDIARGLEGRGLEWTVPTVRVNYESDLDLFHLMLLSKYLDDLGWGSVKVLKLPYLPYSRMDRTENRSAFTLRHLADLINGLGYREVSIGEPHSDVSPALIRNCKVIWMTPKLVDLAVRQTGFDIAEDHLYFPDAGAEKRYAKMFPNFRYIVGAKKRDFGTGQILSIEVGHFEGVARRVIMVDDLCAYGGTFLGGARALEAVGIKSGCLVVAHCENSIYQGNLLSDPFFSHVFTTNSIHPEMKNEKVRVMKAQI